MKNIDQNLILKALNSGKVFSVNYYNDGKLSYRFDFIKSNDKLFYAANTKIYEYSNHKALTFDSLIETLLNVYANEHTYEFEFFIQNEEEFCYIEKAFTLKELETL